MILLHSSKEKPSIHISQTRSGVGREDAKLKGKALVHIAEDLPFSTRTKLAKSYLHFFLSLSSSTGSSQCPFNLHENIRHM